MNLPRATELKAALRPRVALVGPKGGGKTMYRNFLANGLEQLPAYLCNTLRVRESGWASGEARVLRFIDPDGWGWHPDVAQEAVTVGGRTWLPQVGGTNWMTCHDLPLPDLVGAPSVPETHLVDFPGEYWKGMQALRGAYDGLEAEDRALLGSCKVILLMLPFWMLLPREVRRIPPPQLLAIGQHLGLDATTLLTQRQVREDVLLDSAQAWLQRLREVIAPARTGHGPTLLVTFTMLGADWRLELQDPLPDSAGAAVEALGRVRQLITHPLAMGQRLRDLPEEELGLLGTLTGWSRHASQVLDATTLRNLLGRLHGACRDYLTACQRLWRPGQAGQPVARALDELLETAGRRRVRYLAMNLVHERALLAPRAGDGLTYLPLEPAGALLPSVYLCGSLDGF